MKAYGKWKAEKEAIQQQLVEATKNGELEALKEEVRFRGDLGFNAGTLKNTLAEGRKNK
jgi:hypothetical protein